MEIELSNGEVSTIDDDMAHLQIYKWRPRGKYGYPSRTIQENGKTFIIRLHHAIMGYPLGGLQIDHINGNKLDNRKENLRFVTSRENNQNRICHRLGHLVGTHRIRCRKCVNKDHFYWIARARISGKQKTLGTFNSPEKAHKRYMIVISNLKAGGPLGEELIVNSSRIRQPNLKQTEVIRRLRLGNHID